MNQLRTRVSLAGLGVVLAVVVLALTVGATSASINAVTVNGTATTPNGALPVPDNTWAWLLNPDKSIHGVSHIVTDTGAFSFAGVAPGAYFVRVVPPLQQLDLAPSNIRPVLIVTTTGTINLPPLAMTIPSVTGTVYAPGGITPTNAMVKVFAGPVLVEDRPTFNGDFVIGGLPTGTYMLRAEPLPDDLFWPSQPLAVPIEPSAPKYVTLTLQPTQISGVVKDGPNFIEGARVHAITLGGERRSDVTGPLGRFAIGDLPLRHSSHLDGRTADRSGRLAAAATHDGDDAHQQCHAELRHTQQSGDRIGQDQHRYLGDARADRSAPYGCIRPR